MTVRELIEELEQLENKDAEIMFFDGATQEHGIDEVVFEYGIYYLLEG